MHAAQQHRHADREEQYTPGVFAVSEGNMAWSEASHGVLRLQRFSPVGLLAHAGKTEGIEIFRPRVDALVRMHLPSGHGNERALWNERAVQEGEVLDGNAEDESWGRRMSVDQSS